MRNAIIQTVKYRNQKILHNLHANAARKIFPSEKIFNKLSSLKLFPHSTHKPQSLHSAYNRAITVSTNLWLNFGFAQHLNWFRMRTAITDQCRSKYFGDVCSWHFTFATLCNSDRKQIEYNKKQPL